MTCVKSAILEKLAGHGRAVVTLLLVNSLEVSYVDFEDVVKSRKIISVDLFPTVRYLC